MILGCNPVSIQASSKTAVFKGMELQSLFATVIPVTAKEAECSSWDSNSI